MKPPVMAWGLSREELSDLCVGLGERPFRAAQIWRWLYVKRAPEWSAMLNLPAPLRRELACRLLLAAWKPATAAGAERGTRKLLVRLFDGESVEEVLIPAPGRRTVCVSSQVGCKFHCAFCASGQSGYRRDLSAGEIVGQVMLAAETWGDPPTHLVFMGIGEPLDNYEAVLKAIRIVNDGEGLSIGARRITISTCGVIAGIRRLAGEGLQVELSVSLHSAEDEVRSRLMPVNRAHGVEAVLRVCREYSAQTGRMVTFEYTLMDGINDSPDQARRLADALDPGFGRVNLILLNPIAEFPARPSRERVARAFVEILAGRGINATLRAPRGRSVDAACGQLRCREAAGV